MGNFQEMLQVEEARAGLPRGILGSIVQQETGGKEEFITSPSKYHYGVGKDGKRVAGHTGKVSTAFGPFGLLESTAKQPGYGTKPLQDKSLQEQVRFAADYVSGRIKQAGSIAAGLAGYGEGDSYARQVMRRAGLIDSKSTKPESVEKVVPVAKEVVSPAVVSRGEQFQGLGFGGVTEAVNTRLAELAGILGGGGDSSVLPSGANKVSVSDLDFLAQVAPALAGKGNK